MRAGGSASTAHPAGYKNQFNLELGRMSQVSEIKLIRTDTTLDLSQKAMKRYLMNPSEVFLLSAKTTAVMGSILVLTGFVFRQLPG